MRTCMKPLLHPLVEGWKLPFVVGRQHRWQCLKLAFAFLSLCGWQGEVFRFLLSAWHLHFRSVSAILVLLAVALLSPAPWKPFRTGCREVRNLFLWPDKSGHCRVRMGCVSLMGGAGFRNYTGAFVLAKSSGQGTGWVHAATFTGHGLKRGNNIR